MTTDVKQAIDAAKEDIETEKRTALKNQVYTYLKSELESVDSIDAQIRKLNESKRAHEENIKNIKDGNLQAIQERAVYQNMPQIFLTNSSLAIPTGFTFFRNFVAGTVITVNGKSFYF